MGNPLKTILTLGGGAVIAEAAYISDYMHNAGSATLQSDLVQNSVTVVANNPSIFGLIELGLAGALQYSIIRADNTSKSRHAEKVRLLEKAILETEDTTKTPLPASYEEATADTKDNAVQDKHIPGNVNIKRPSGLEERLKDAPLTAAKLGGAVVTGALALDGLRRLPGAGFVGKGLEHMADGANYLYTHSPFLPELVQRVSESAEKINLPDGAGKLAAAGLAGLAILAIGYKANSGDHPEAIAKMTTHYRFLPWMHWDWVGTHLFRSTEYENIRGSEGRRPSFVANSILKLPEGSISRNVIFKAGGKMYMWDRLYHRGIISRKYQPSILPGFLLPIFGKQLKQKRFTTEATVDVPYVRAKKESDENPTLMGYSIDLGNPNIQGSNREVLIQEKYKSLSESWAGIIINPLAAIGSRIPLLNRLVSKPRETLMELGRLYDVIGDINLGEQKAVLNEDVVYSCKTLGAKRFELQSEDKQTTYAVITRDPIKRILSLGFWRDYDVAILDERLLDDEGIEFLNHVVDIVHNDRKEHKLLKRTYEHKDALPSVLQYFKT